MTNHETLSHGVFSISASESPDMAALGMSDEHLRDAMAEIARHLLALGARVVYGGDLRAHGFAELLFELIARHRRDADPTDQRASVTNYLAWPVHIREDAPDLERYASELDGSARLVLLTLNGDGLTMEERRSANPAQPTQAQWTQGLSVMRKVILNQTQARIVLGGRIEGYRGIMPGIAEESLLSLETQQPLFLIGGFGGCTRDIASALGLDRLPWTRSNSEWAGREAFEAFTAADLNNGLTFDENGTLARTPHVDEAVMLILRGLFRLAKYGSPE